MKESVRALMPAVPMGAVVVFALMSPATAIAEPSTADAAEKAERCATRLFTAMVGESASTEALASANPQGSFDALVKDPRFVERFSRFINSQFNRVPGRVPAEDAAYYMTKYVVENDKPWAEMFTGGYDVAPTDPNNPGSAAAVTVDADGLGYFRSRAWSLRYAGNEGEGMRIVTAYRIMQNTIGLRLEAVTNTPDVDTSATGRKGGVCAGCHYKPWYALDSVAQVLGTREGTGNDTEFRPPTGGPASILGGVSVANDKELVSALVANEAFDVNACRLAYQYLYGRAEYSCDGPAFDECVAGFKKDKKITSALAVVAKHPSYCE